MTEHRRFGRRGWSGRHWDGNAPPWWPEGEAWPPQDREAWRELRRRFIGRMVGFALLALTILALLGALVVWAFSQVLNTSVATTIAGVVVFVVLVVVTRATLRGLRGSAAPIGDLMAAASRVEAGDYGARVREDGPSDLRRLARAFNAMSTRLEQDADQRRQLLADVSHELRTPLSVIQGNVEGILDGLYPADRAHLEPILEEIDLLERLVDDLRTLSLAETGGLRLHREPTHPADLLGEVVAAFEARAQANGVALREVVAPGLPVIDIDATRMRQVLSNLVANALRFTPRGGEISLTAAANGATTTLEVRDTGPGIAPDALPHVFDRFYRVGDTAGSGLGLPIARSLVEAHGGDIQAVSPNSGGTIIRINLPNGEPAAAS
ncbi:MAG TPA: HAMP domain-containing sensor histidine kinase [Candidatus Limnocylindria bacterium]|nr:HAMP domain-containing sensor histidine kinase [Candidatus Limnocylindria bacterium]